MVKVISYLIESRAVREKYIEKRYRLTANFSLAIHFGYYLQNKKLFLLALSYSFGGGLSSSRPLNASKRGLEE